jgi:hypothetical protein
MTEVCRQQRKPRLRVNAIAIAVEERAYGKAVAQVMKLGSMAADPKVEPRALDRARAGGSRNHESRKDEETASSGALPVEVWPSQEADACWQLRNVRVFTKYLFEGGALPSPAFPIAVNRY